MTVHCTCRINVLEMQRKNEFEKKIYKKLHVIVLFTWYIYNELGASTQKINASYWKKCDWFLITFMYNEWNFLHSYKINSYKLISLEKKKWVYIKIIYQ